MIFFTSCAGPSGAGQREAPSHPVGGTLHMVQEAPLTLDPLRGDSVYESLPVNQIFDTLVTFDASLNLAPLLARTWTISRNGMIYTFTLRDDVRFHNGQELTAADVAFTVQRNLRPGDETRSLAYSSLLNIHGADAYSAGQRQDVPGIRVIDSLTIEFRLTKPYRSFLEVLAMEPMAVVPEQVLREVGDEVFGREPVGTGPFRLVEWSPQRLLLTANRSYFRDEPHLDEVEIRFFGEDESDFGAERFFRGELDVLEPTLTVLARLNEEPAIEIRRYHELSLSFLGLNTSRPPLDQRWLRQAIGHALDRGAMVRESPSVRREAAGILPPGISGYSPEFKALSYRPEEAHRLLAEAGHPNGAGLPPVRLSMPAMSAAARRILEQIRQDLERVGIRLEIVPVTWPELSQQLEDHTVEAFLLAWVADRTDPDAFLRSLFEADGSANYFGYRSETAEELLERGAREMNPQLSARIYHSLERHILSDAPMIPLYHTVGVVAFHEHVRGFEPGPLGIAKVDLERVWLEPGS